MARNNVIIYVNNSNSAILESKQGVLLFQNDTVFEIDINFLKTLKSQYSKYYEGFCCLGLHKILFGNKLAHFLIIVTNCTVIGKIQDNDIYKIISTHFICINSNISYEEDYSGISEMKKFLNSGNFYFTFDNNKPPLDLTINVQSSCKTPDNRFFWNKVPYSYLVQNGINNAHKWFCISICGSIELKTCYAGNKKAKICLISRYGCQRAGTRFNVRGINDNGFVANFVETEQVIYIDEEIYSSFIQIRGSIPLFWEQTGLQVGAHKIQLSRGFEATCPAFNRHMYLLTKMYNNVLLLNLVGSKDGEKLLTEAYESHYRVSPFSSRIPMVHFDYHSNCRNVKNASEVLGKLWEQTILPNLHDILDSFKVCKTSPPNAVHEKVDNVQQPQDVFAVSGKNLNLIRIPERQQIVVIRTNCVDCIDRTNACQSFIGRQILAQQLKALGITDRNHFARFDELLRTMWVVNGDRLSNIYAGTGALECKGKIKEGALSVTRTIQSNFLDESRQIAMDLLLLNSTSTHYLKYVNTIFPINTFAVSNELIETLYYWYREITQPQTLRIFIGTWNVNGGRILTMYDKENLSEWLTVPIYKTNSKKLPQPRCDEITPDIYLVGFQEIIDLNAKNIAMTNIENQKFWESEIHAILSLKGRYVSVITSQLVGVCFFVFANESIVHLIRDVSVTKVKTGLGGTAGNKGGICVHFSYGANLYSFVCAHLAAGQSQVRDRNSDFAEISAKINPIVCYSNYYFWFGDFNYRIDMPIDNVKDYVRDKRWEQLLAAEQLTLQRSHDQVFKEFKEGAITFAPTYKYDLGSDIYDTSDKGRIPAWTDRILWKARSRPGFRQSPLPTPLSVDKDKNTTSSNTCCELLVYNRAELKSSDHRPVFGIFDTEVQIFNNEYLSKNFEAIILAAGPLDRSVRIYLEIQDALEQYDAFDRGDNLELGEDDFDNSDLKIIYQNLYDTLVANAGEIVWLRFDQTGLEASDNHLLLTLGIDSDQANVGNKRIRIFIFGLTCTFAKGYSASYAVERLNKSSLNVSSTTPESSNTENLIQKRIKLHVYPCNVNWLSDSSKSLSNLIKANAYLSLTDGLFDKILDSNLKSPFARLLSETGDKSGKQASDLPMSPLLSDAFDNDIGIDSEHDVNTDLKSTDNLVQSYYDLYQRRPTLKEELIASTKQIPTFYRIPTTEDSIIPSTTVSKFQEPNVTMKWLNRLSLGGPNNANDNIVPDSRQSYSKIVNNVVRSTRSSSSNLITKSGLPPSRPPPPKVQTNKSSSDVVNGFSHFQTGNNSQLFQSAITTATTSCLLDLDDLNDNFPSNNITCVDDLLSTHVVESRMSLPDQTNCSNYSHYPKAIHNNDDTTNFNANTKINQNSSLLQSHYEARNYSLNNQRSPQMSTFYDNPHTNNHANFQETFSDVDSSIFYPTRQLNDVIQQFNNYQIVQPELPPIPVRRTKMGPPKI